MATMEGPLVLADISGYTNFMAATELEHSDVLVRRMLNTIVASLKGRLEMAQLEGDAVFFVGEGLAPELIRWLERSYLTFHRRMRTFLERRQCACDACGKAPELTLKLIAHYGRYSRQRIGETGQVHGVDVIVPHRLAKNSIPSREYILATGDLLERLPEAQRSSFVPTRRTPRGSAGSRSATATSRRCATARRLSRTRRADRVERALPSERACEACLSGTAAGLGRLDRENRRPQSENAGRRRPSSS